MLSSASCSGSNWLMGRIRDGEMGGRTGAWWRTLRPGAGQIIYSRAELHQDKEGRWWLTFTCPPGLHWGYSYSWPSGHDSDHWASQMFYQSVVECPVKERLNWDSGDFFLFISLFFPALDDFVINFSFFYEFLCIYFIYPSLFCYSCYLTLLPLVVKVIFPLQSFVCSLCIRVKM